ncbi:MAG TPA: EAL domain-containing protein [Actinomycetota bacterium]|jgi:EAL domain-containing protein (putative c-di-GMP-specific phosphodiesterase class I)|nr:EAL domain-containing protein [Actinomycetota bacterium]
MADERVPEGAWIHSFKCARCRLEFTLLSARPDRHTVFNVSCPQCGNAGAFLHFRTEAPEERAGAWPWKNSLRMFDSMLYSVDGPEQEPADRVDPVELAHELSELTPERSVDAAEAGGDRAPARPARRALGQILISNGFLSPAELDRALELHRRSGRSLGRELVAHGLIEEAELVRALAEQLGLEYVDLSEVRPDPTATAMLSRTLAERYRAIPIAARGGALLVAMSDPTNVYALDDIRTITGCEVQPVVSTAADIEAAIGWLSPSILPTSSRPPKPPPSTGSGLDELQRALDQGELRLHYLPIVELASARIWGVEALVRWQHPTRGLLGPADFLPLAEETGSIVAVGTWVLHQACHEGLRLQEASGRQLDVSVNVSVRQLEQPDLVEQVVRALGSTGLQPRTLILEITETARINDMDRVIATLQELKAFGVRLAVDNFGRGYASLEYVQRFPIDILKIHGSFIDSVTAGGDSATLSAAVIELAGILNFQRVAVGIERADQVQLLRQLGCDAAEGEYFGRPIPVDAMADLLRAKSSNAP